MGKRLFIAADISEDARRVASDLIAELRSAHPGKGVSWVKPENLHVTIKFLGDTDEQTEAKLIETLERIVPTYQPFRLHLEKPEVLGKRVISIAVRSDSQTVFSLEMVIDTECGRLGYEREARRFHPHVTIARIREPKSAKELSRRFLETKLERTIFPVREIVLYKSEMGPRGSVYSPLRKFPLNSSE